MSERDVQELRDTQAAFYRRFSALLPPAQMVPFALGLGELVQRAVGLGRAQAPAPLDLDDQLCVCGHCAHWHGNDGTGHCGATKACRGQIHGCKTFRPAPRSTGAATGDPRP